MICFDSPEELERFVAKRTSELAAQLSSAGRALSAQKGSCGFAWYHEGGVLMRCQGHIGHLGDHGEADGGTRCAR